MQSIDDINQLIQQILQSLLTLSESPYFPFVMTLIGIIVLIFCVWFIGRFLKFIVRRSRSIPLEAKNGASLIIELFQIFIIAFGISFFMGVDLSALITTSTVLATAIGFASASIAANIVGGLYISLTRPFGVGDLISTQGTEGIILEIGLNYTRLLRLDRTILTIPNSALMNAAVLNSNISAAEERKYTEKAKEVRFRNVSVKIPNLLTEGVLYSLDQSELVRYVLKVELKLEGGKAVTSTVSHLNKICKEYQEIFGFPISYYFGSVDFRLDTYFVITAKDPIVILDNYSTFLETIVKAHYSELQED